MAAVSNDLLEELRSLPRDFFGTVEITYQNGVPGLIRISRTRKLSTTNLNGTSLGVERDDRKQAQP
jgi:hypothetical protein